MRELLTELVASAESGKPCVYCSVVETRGSTPQKAGAAMLVFADGSQRGTLGGGCVEEEVKQRALRVLLNGTNESPEILTFLLDDNYGWDDGLICGGRMTILADPVLASRRAYYRSLLGLAEAGQGFTEAIVLKAESTDPPIGSRYLFGPDGSVVGQTMAGTVPEAVLSSLTPLPRRPECSVAKGIAYLPVLPRITLLIVGGGHVGQAVARLASQVDFDIWVVDDRQTYVSKERFPTAERLIVGDIGQTLEKLVREGIGKSTYCLVVTRGHGHDEEALYHLANTAASYVGMIGSKRKIQLIYEDLRAKGISAEALARVHAPLGLRIGSRTVPEIAVSIVAELIACRNMPGDRRGQESPS